MTKLEQFRRTPAGRAILGGAIFVSIFASPAYASLGNPETFASKSTEQVSPPSKPVAPAISTAQLTEMLTSSIEDLEAYTLDLQSQKTVSERHLHVLKALENLVDDVTDLFQVGIDELSPVEKVALARRIVENNLRLTKARLSAEPATVEAEIVSLPQEDTATKPSSYSQLASDRQNLLDAIEETRIDIDYVVDEIAKSQNENAYYRDALQQVSELFERILVASKPTEGSLRANFAALKAWQKEFRDEMASTEDVPSAVGR